MTPVIYSLPYDPQADNPRNRVLREYHDLTEQVGLDYRVITLNHGHFFVKNLEIVDDTGYELAEADFQCVMVNAEATMATGQEVAAVVVIVNPNVSHKVFVNASMVGGIYCNLTPAIAQASLGLLNPTRFPTWRNVENKPDKFDVGGHLHAMWELYGFEGMCNALERIVELKLLATRKRYEELRDALAQRLDKLREENTELNRQLAEHIAQPNPHSTTKTHIGLSNLANYRPINTAEATTPGYNSNQRYLVVGGYRNMIQTNFTPDLEQHINDTNNPHRLTPDQVQTLSRAVIDSALDAKLTRGDNAVSSQRFEGRLYPAMYSYMRNNLPADYVTSGTFNISRLVGTPGNNQTAVVGNNQVTDVHTLIRNHITPNTRIVYLTGADGQNVPAVLLNTFANNTEFPVGTLALTMISYYQQVGYGNGAYTYTWNRLRVYIKASTTSWQIL